MLLLRSILFQILFTGWTYLLALCAVPCLIDTAKFGGYAVARLWANGSLFLLRACCNITYRIEGLENLPQGSALFASKHQSAWDTMIFWPLLRNPSYVLKKELLLIPLFGWYLTRLRNIPIDRDGGSKALKAMVASAKLEVEANRAIVIFPEGTRVPFGTMGEYQPGAAMLANQLGIPVIPVALNSGACWARDALLKKPGVITLRFLPPLPEKLSSRDLMSQLQQAIEDGCAALPPAR
jgi:1-acyl-sn-glycerol-3-phosphate acyltransferase